MNRVIARPRCDDATPFACIALELLAEFGEFVGADIADRPVVQSALAPAADVESLHGLGPWRRDARCSRSAPRTD